MEIYRYIAASVSVGMAIGVIIAMFAGTDGISLPVGIGAGMEDGEIAWSAAIAHPQSPT